MGQQNGQLSLVSKIKYTLVREFLYSVVRLWGLEGLYWFGQKFGFCESVLKYKRQARICRRLDQIFEPVLSKKEKRHIARRQTARIRCDKMLYTIMDKLDRQVLLERLHLEGSEHLDKAIERGKGTFLMFSHQGAQHLGGMFLALKGYGLDGLRDPKQSNLRMYVQEQFEETFPESRDFNIKFSGEFVRAFFRRFKNNNIVAAALDVRRDRGNVRTTPVRIFGGEQEFVSGMTQIALRCKAAPVVGFILSEKDFHFRIIISPWLNDPDSSQDDPETVQQVMQRYADLIEQHVKKYPCHISKTR